MIAIMGDPDEQDPDNSAPEIELKSLNTCKSKEIRQPVLILESTLPYRLLVILENSIYLSRFWVSTMIRFTDRSDLSDLTYPNS